MLRPFSPTTVSTVPQLVAVRDYFSEHGVALQNSAALIEGDAGAASVLRIISELRTATQLDRAMRSRLVALHRLLSLDSGTEPFDPDQSPCIFLDPESSEVEQICLLTDSLLDLLILIAELDEQQDKAAMNPKSNNVA
jgi:hypothetical protein